MVATIDKIHKFKKSVAKQIRAEIKEIRDRVLGLCNTISDNTISESNHYPDVRFPVGKNLLFVFIHDEYDRGHPWMHSKTLIYKRWWRWVSYAPIYDFTSADIKKDPDVLVVYYKIIQKLELMVNADHVVDEGKEYRVLDLIRGYKEVMGDNK